MVKRFILIFAQLLKDLRQKQRLMVCQLMVRLILEHMLMLLNPMIAMAIMVYLTRRHPEPALLPTEPEAFVRALEWMSWLTSRSIFVWSSLYTRS